MLLFFETYSEYTWVVWLTAFFAFIFSVLNLAIFIVHRRNIKRSVSELEMQMHEYDARIAAKSEEHFAKFKTALHLHLKEISLRVTQNEERTNKLVNQLEALRLALLEETPPLDEAPAIGENAPIGDDAIVNKPEDE